MTDMLIQTRLPGDMGDAVAHIANDEGESVAGWVRRLIFREVNLAHVKAWVVPARRPNPMLVFTNRVPPLYQLRPRRDITPLDRIFELADPLGRHVQDHALLAQDWYAKPDDFRFVLDRSPTPWVIVTIIGHEITLHAEVDHPKG